MQWRYFDRPGGEYVLHTLDDGRQVSGFAVTKRYNRDGTIYGHIIDWHLPESHSTHAASLLNSAFSQMRSWDVERVSCWADGDIQLQQALLQAGLTPSGRKSHLCYYVLSGPRADFWNIAPLGKSAWPIATCTDKLCGRLPRASQLRINHQAAHRFRRGRAVAGDLLPIFFVVAVAIKLDSSGPVFFRQERIGYRGRTFRIFKFRTMAADADRLTRGLPGDASSPLITKVGRYLRDYRIDEFPQLINVVRGEMSLVGPRPLVPLYAHAWTNEERKRLNLRPGMTGWQQINGAGTLNWTQAPPSTFGTLTIGACGSILSSYWHALGSSSQRHRIWERWAGSQFNSRSGVAAFGNGDSIG